MALQSDENGFLVGQTVQDLKRVGKGLDAIRKDVHEIKKLLGMKPNDTQPRPVNLPPVANTDNGTNHNGRLSSESPTPPSPSQSLGVDNVQLPDTSTTSTDLTVLPTIDATIDAGSVLPVDLTTQVDSTAPVPPTPPVIDDITPPVPATIDAGDTRTARARDANGRFTSENHQDTIDATPNGGRARGANGRFTGNGLDKDTKSGGNESSLGDMFDNLGDRITTALNTDGLEEIDPTVKAFQETVEPLKRGWQFLMSGSDKKDKPYFAWFNKIWKTLKKTEDNTAEQGEKGGGLMGLIMGAVTAGIAALGLSSITDSKGESLLDKGVNYAKDKSGYNGAVDWTSENIIKPVMEDPLGTAAKLLVEGWKVQLDLMGAAWNTVMGSLVPLLVGSWNAVLGWFGENIMPTLSAGWNKVVAAGASTFEWVVKKFEPITDFVKSIFGFIGDRFDAVMKFAGDVFAAFSTFMKDKFGIDIPVIIDVVTNKAKEITQPAFDKADEAKKAVTDFADSAKKSALETTETVKTFTSSLLVDAKSLGGSVIEGAGNVASKIGNSIIGTANASEKPYSGDAAVGNAAGVSSKKGGSVADLIQWGESKARGYNDYNRGGKGAASNRENLDLTNMTIGEIRAKQRLPVGHKDRIFAAGKYQIIGSSNPDNDTLGGAVDALGLDENAKFDEKMQERIFTDYLANKKRPKIESFIKGIPNKKGEVASVQDAGKAVAQEWASVGASAKGGSGWYDGDGSNHASINAGEMESALIKSRAKYKELIASGIEERKAYGIALGSYSDSKPTITHEQITAAMPKSQATTMPTQTVSQAAPVMPVMPKMPKQTEAPPIITPLASDAKAMPQPVMVSDIGQGLPDQRIAHIASPYGGFKGS